MRCVHCNRREIEKDSLFTHLCKKCSGQNKLVARAKEEVFYDIETWLEEADWRGWDSDYLNDYDKMKESHIPPLKKKNKPKEGD